MKRIIYLSILAATAIAFAGDAHQSTSVSPATALERLTNGNHRFKTGRSVHPDQSVSVRQALAKGQSPFAIIVTCSDSRLSPEILFDQGIGRLFVVRVAGNTVDKVALGSIEYAVANLGARTIVVLGHEKCGAVQAAVAGKPLPGSIGAVTEAISGAVEKTKEVPGDHVTSATLENVRETVRNIRASSSIVGDLEKSGQLRVVGGKYFLASGEARLFKVN